jgi:TadE-like protein
MTRKHSGCRGQSLVEFALIMPLVLIVALGVIDFGYALLDQHVVTKLSREGANLISRDTSIEAAATAMQSMSTQPVDFSTNSRLIFSVLKKGATVGTANYDRIILYQRHEIGSLTGVSSRLGTAGGSFRGAPNYEAINSDTDTNLQITSPPANIVMQPGGLLYVTEIFTQHTPLTPLENFGIPLPHQLYSIAYF